MSERIDGPMSTETLIAEYAELCRFGVTFEAAARRLNIHPRSLEKRLERAGYQWREKVA